MDANRCLICGEIIPEGREVCPSCTIREIKPIKEESTKDILENIVDDIEDRIFDLKDDRRRQPRNSLERIKLTERILEIRQLQNSIKEIIAELSEEANYGND